MAGALRIRLLFVDDGEYHSEEVQLPAGITAGYERLLDCLMEEPEVLKRLHLDFDRLVSAQLLDD